MILYFSGTGNSKYVASRIKDSTDDEIFSIEDCIKVNNYKFSLDEGESLGIICPTYFFGVPVIVEDFLKRVRFTGVFQNTLDAAKLSCDNNETCNIIDKQFPLEEALIPQVVELIVKELSAAIYKPNDNHNNADDDLANVNIKQSNQ